MKITITERSIWPLYGAHLNMADYTNPDVVEVEVSEEFWEEYLQAEREFKAVQNTLGRLMYSKGVPELGQAPTWEDWHLMLRQYRRLLEKHSK